MKYLNLLTDSEIKKLIMNYITEPIQNIEIKRSRDYIHVKADVLVDDGTVEDNYYLKDYFVDVVDWAGDTIKSLRKYRQFMLDKFGNQYAREYLLEQR